MRATSVKGLLRAFPPVAAILVLSILLFGTTSTRRDDSPPQSPPLRPALLRKLMQQDHRFVPASSPLLNYYGRWIATSNQLRKDASFPGSYLEFDICNTTSLYVTLGNRRRDALSSDEAVKIDTRQLSIQPNREYGLSSPPVSLFLQVDQKQEVFFNRTGHGTLAVSSTLDKSSCYSIKLTYLAPANGQTGTLEFEGIWLDKGGNVRSSEAHEADDLVLGNLHLSTIQPALARKHFELVTNLPINNLQDTHRSWPALLARHSNVSNAIFPTLSYCLTPTCSPGSPTISDIFFRSGPPGTSYFNVPYRFTTPYPSALILDIGLQDYQIFLHTKPSTHSINQFITNFIKQYTTFISLIRSTGYHYHSYASQRGSILEEHASFTYNSAPSTLPIFLLTPFTPSKQLHRLLSHAMAEVVNTVQKQGDKSTFWIDTSGWLTTEDFLPTQDEDHETNESVKLEDRKRVHGRSESTATQLSLTPRAHRLISTYLSAHLCRYLSSPNSHSSPLDNNTSSTFFTLSSLSASSPCPFNKHDNYLGHLYLPTEAGMGKMLEERKIELVKMFVGWEEMVS